jgi:hypothetical protein
MAELKTKATAASVEEFIDSVADEQRREDCRAVAAIMQRVTNAKPKMWGPSIVGFGDYRYQGSNNKYTDWFVVGFSPRKDALTLYLQGGIMQSGDLLEKLGRHKTGKGCLYIKKMSDIDLDVLTAIVQRAMSKPGGV